LSWAYWSPLGPWTKWEHSTTMWRTPKVSPRMSSFLATTLGGQSGHSSHVGGSICIKFESISDSRSNLY
jgi:hypothetical protein